MTDFRAVDPEGFDRLVEVMARAMYDARSISLDAPVEISLKMSFSAARPARSPQISSKNLLRLV